MIYDSTYEWEMNTGYVLNAIKEVCTRYTIKVYPFLPSGTYSICEASPSDPVVFVR
jgi:hypothetical protein